MNTARAPLCCFLFAIALFPVHAQTPSEVPGSAGRTDAPPMGDLSTERPGFTSSSGTAGAGVVQLEQGYSLQSGHSVSGRNTLFTGPISLIRLGISDGFELRFSSNGCSWLEARTSQGRSSLSGANDFGVGAKAKLLRQRGWVPEVSITGALSLPARGSAFSTSGHDPSATLAASENLPGKVSLTANAIVASVTDPLGRYYSGGESIWASRAFKRASVYGEVFRTSSGRHESGTIANSLGLFRSFGRHIQVDAGIGHTMSGAQPGWFATAGVVLRDPRQIGKTDWPGFGGPTLPPKTK